ncbi:hypothetical protein CVUC_00105 [Caulobacter vibrioides]|nr:hypothetical protein CVUC_00105 [Caulobacter vibrioides]
MVLSLFVPALSGKNVPTHPPTASRWAPPSLPERGTGFGGRRVSPPLLPHRGRGTRERGWRGLVRRGYILGAAGSDPTGA